MDAKRHEERTIKIRDKTIDYVFNSHQIIGRTCRDISTFFWIMEQKNPAFTSYEAMANKET